MRWNIKPSRRIFFLTRGFLQNRLREFRCKPDDVRWACFTKDPCIWTQIPAQIGLVTRSSCRKQFAFRYRRQPLRDRPVHSDRRDHQAEAAFAQLSRSCQLSQRRPEVSHGIRRGVSSTSELHAVHANGCETDLASLSSITDPFGLSLSSSLRPLTSRCHRTKQGRGMPLSPGRSRNSAPARGSF